ncbi:glycosyltransferase family 2 protein [Thermomonospora amylolytica]|uniref:glycosyltransferase family 2 protein n=1 Tax=Thermomonospora amylolytica TaxID=1411117 RepID=UPI001F1BC7B6|nr:glycosyltransferase [Thermomonospora amylolytica]
MKISVVIATRDRWAELARTLRRLAALPERPPVVVVDNASRDGTPRRVREAFPQVRVVMLPRNLGACARNVGVAHTATPYVAFSDDDSWWEPGALAEAARRLDACPRLGVLVGRIHLAPDGRIDRASAKMAVAPLGREPDLPGPSVLGFPACAAVVRRAAFEAAGGFHRLLFFGGEETLLALDLAVAGWGLAYVGEVRAWHAPSPHRETAPLRWALHRRNDLLVSWMRRPLSRALAGTGGLALRAGTGDGAALAALLGLARRLPAALARRRRLPPVIEHRLRVLHELE